MSSTTVPVLIVGGGPVGLAASLFLAEHGIRSLLVERHSGTSIHPRARGINFRTMELFRELGLEASIRAAGSELVANSGMLIVETLVGTERARIAMAEPFSSSQSTGAISPTSGCMCAQDQLEPLLLASAQRRGCEVYFNTELVSFEQDLSGVTARVREIESGQQQTIAARYMIAADGPTSRIRQALGIPTSGRGSLGHQINIYFAADLGDLVRGREFIICQVENPKAAGLLLAVNNTNLWLFQLPYHPEQGETAEDFPAERCIDLLHKAIGVPGLPIEIKSMLPWEAAVRVADSFQQERVFLAGDAAHQMPPMGAFGMNTGIQDAQNLAWKLAAVIEDHAAPALLSTYDVERRPVARFTAEQAGMRSARSAMDPAAASRAGLADPLVITAGYQYRSHALLLEDETPLALDHLDLHGQPGRRAPHLWLERDGARLSTLDLFGSHWVLLAGEDGHNWYDAAQKVAGHLGIGLDSYRCGSSGDLIDVDGRWCERYGATPRGAVLVRPDGFVGWRSKDAEQQQEHTLEQVIHYLVCRSD
ncbi:MAG TPA: FAD-dependent monooxygenase [Ktedonobacterales bacterium]